MTDGLTTSFVHVPSFDGLRGVAVAAVVVYHLWPHALPGGFIGVDVFFVLSGFLLTSLLVREVDATGGIRLGRFFVRRTRRLLPAMLMMTTAVAVYALTWADAVEFERLRRHGLATLLYAVNWVFLSDGTTYTDVVAGESPLRHVWSLSIEEQFYLVLALAVAIVAAKSPSTASSRRRVIGGAIVFGLISAALMILSSVAGSSVSRLYFGSDTRAQALLVGAALGATLRGSPVAASRRVSCATVVSGGVLVVVAVIASETATWMYRGGFTITALAAGMLIVGGPATPWIVRRLEWRPLRLLGNISYGVYLWHWPLLIIFNESRLGIDGFAHRLIILAMTLTISTLSYRLVEQPIRTGAIDRRWGNRSLMFAPTATMAAAGLLIVATIGPPSLGADAGDVDAAGSPLKIGAEIEFAEPSQASQPTTPQLSIPTTIATPSTTIPAEAPATISSSTTTTSTTVVERVPGPIRVAALGDSVMHTMIGGRLLSGLQAAPWDPADSVFDPERIEVRSIARAACSLLPGDVALQSLDGEYRTLSMSSACGDWQGDLDDAVINDAGDADVVMVLLSNDLEDRLIDGSIVPFGSFDHTVLFFDLLDHIRDNIAGTPLVLVAPAPRMIVGTTDAKSEREKQLVQLFYSYTKTRAGVHVIDIGAVLCPDDDCAHPLGHFKPAWRFDGLHFSESGAIWMANWLTPQLEEIAAYS